MDKESEKRITKALIKILHIAESTMLKKSWFNKKKKFIGTEQERVWSNIVSQFIESRLQSENKNENETTMRSYN